MSDPKNAPETTTSDTTEAGAVELTEADLDKVSGGPIYMKVDGVTGKLNEKTNFDKGGAFDNVAIKL